MEEKTAEEQLLRDVYNYLSADISRNERDLSFINSDIDRLNETVGAEIKKLESENRAREFMKKYHQLRPLLESVNLLYREIKDLDDTLASLHTKKNELRRQLSLCMEEFKHSYSASETGSVAKKVSDINAQIVLADNEEEDTIRQKEEKIEQFKLAKIKANEFLDSESYELEEIIIAEDKVVGELEYAVIKKEYETLSLKRVTKKFPLKKCTEFQKNAHTKSNLVLRLTSLNARAPLTRKQLAIVNALCLRLTLCFW